MKFQYTSRRNKRIKTRRIRNRNTLGMYEKFSLILYSAAKLAIVGETNLLRESALRASKSNAFGIHEIGWNL